MEMAGKMGATDCISADGDVISAFRKHSRGAMPDVIFECVGVPGMIQHMSAGSGIRHSEFNPLDAETHLLQIWIEPREMGIAPGHQSRAYPIHDERNVLHLLASHDGEGDSVRIETDARMFAGTFGAGVEVHHQMRELRHAWVQVVRGEVRVNGERLSAGDGIAMDDIDAIGFVYDADSEIIVFELA